MRYSRLLVWASVLALFACSPGSTTGGNPDKPTVSVNASTQTVMLGSNTQVTIYLVTTNATLCTRLLPDNAVVSGSFMVVPTQTTTYSGTCTGPGGSASWSITITVTVPAPIVSVTATPASIELGLTVTVRIQSQYADNGCRLNDAVVPDSFTITPTATITDTIVCTGVGGTTKVPFTVVVTAVPAINIQAYGVDGTGQVSVTGVTAIVSSGSWSDSLTLGSNGSGAMPAPASVRALFGDSICVKIVDRTQNSTLKSSIGCTGKNLALAGEVLSFVLGTKVWSITQGSFAGNQVAISLIKAETPAGDGSIFYLMTNLTNVRLWKFPIVWSINRTVGNLGAADSVNIIAGLSHLAAKLGPPFSFQAGQMGVSVLDTLGLQFKQDSSASSEGSAGWGGGSSLQWATITLRALADFQTTGSGSPFYIEHEMIHILGFGHTCSWPTVMSVTTCPVGSEPTEASVNDIAYIQFFYAVRGMQINLQAKYGLDGMYKVELADTPAGLRALMTAPPVKSAVGNKFFIRD